MEESILGQKQIRSYFKCFSDAHWNKVARASMMLGIKQLMKKNTRSLQGDFSHLSLQDLEDMVGK